MPMPCLTTDLTTLFASKDFGEADGTVVWKGTVIAGAIFDDEDVEFASPEGPTTIGHQAVLSAASAQFPGIAEKDPVTIRGVNYRVAFWMDDGTGVIEIHLTRV